MLIRVTRWKVTRRFTRWKVTRRSTGSKVKRDTRREKMEGRKKLYLGNSGKVSRKELDLKA